MAQFEFRVSETEYRSIAINLYKNEQKVTGLSSGETFMIGLVSLQFDFEKRATRNIIILDEPDRHLDPKLIEQFYKIVYNEFCIKNNIQVIMSTHRHDTISLVPPSSADIGIFVI